MSKDWLDWVRESVGYKDRTLTAAHYDKLFRGALKDVMQFLMAHIRSEQEVRMIKENIALFGGIDGPIRDDEEMEEQNLAWIEEETGRTLLEIQMVEERIRKMELAMSTSGTETADGSAEIVDLQRRTALLAEISKEQKGKLDNICGDANGLESYLMSALTKTDFLSKTNSRDTACPGCKNSDIGSRLMSLCRALEQSKNGKDILSSCGIEELATAHNAACVANGICGLVKNRWASEHAPDESTDMIQVLQREHLELVDELGALSNEKKNVESSVHQAKQNVVAELAKGGASGREEGLGEWLDTQLLIAGCQGAIASLEDICSKRNLNEIKHALKMELSRLANVQNNVNEEQSELESLESKVEDALALIHKTVTDVEEMKSECHQVICEFVENYRKLITLNAQSALSNETAERWRTSLNAVKAAHVFQTALTSEESALSELLVPQVDSLTMSVMSNGEDPPMDILSDVLDGLWQCVQDPEENPHRLRNDLISKEIMPRDQAIIQLMSKLAVSEEKIADLESTMQRVQNALHEWSIREHDHKQLGE